MIHFFNIVATSFFFKVFSKHQIPISIIWSQDSCKAS